jgi:Fe-S cluster assembly iron-binding protein IscA
MLTLTENASSLIKNLAEQTAVADDAGLRISTTDADSTNFAVDFTPSPEPTDQVVENAGARVFLEENAATALSDKVLDAQVDAEGAVRFAIGTPA